VIGGVLFGAGGIRSDALEPSIADLQVSQPTRLCVTGVTEDCRDPRSAEAILRSPELEPEAAALPPGGTQGALVVSFETEDDAHVLAKWRAQDPDPIDDPAKELAAYAVQKLLLPPEDWVIPPVAATCLSYGDLVEATGHAGWQTVVGTDCVLGFLSYWLLDAIGVTEARRRGLLGTHAGSERDPRLFEPERFATDPVYRRNVASLNVLLYLIDNGDLHAGQFVLYPDAKHWFVVDSSIAFESLPNPTLLFIQDLSELHVPRIPAQLVERIRSIERTELQVLRVLSEHVIEDGSLIPVEPSGQAIAGASRVRRHGDRVQIGLREAEITGVWSRIERLRRLLSRGAIGTF
jgi:hypothetical protein